MREELNREVVDIIDLLCGFTTESNQESLATA